MEIKAKLFTDGSEDINSYNNLFDLYDRLWKEAWTELGVSGQSMYDDLYRFDYKIGFFLKEVPIAFHAYQLFDLKRKADQHHTYFKRLPATIVEKLGEHSIRKVATMEYMAVDPDFRKTAGSNVAEILVGFSTQFFAGMDVDGIITVTRNERRVHELCHKYGSTPLLSNFPFYNVATDIMLFSPHNYTLNPNPETQEKIDKLLADVGIFKSFNRKAS
jgi:hypothetical protein